MYWKSKINLDENELYLLNEFANKHVGTSEFKVPNALTQFPSVLNKINKKINEYLPEDYDKYLAQSWSICLTKDMFIQPNPHNHGYSHFSFIFYTMSEGLDPLIIRDVNNIQWEITVKTNDFLIIPNYIIHFIKPGDAAKEHRISFAGDLILTETEYKSSMFLTPISNWYKL